MIKVEDLNVYFGGGAEVHQALKDISFTVAAGESYGLVGESGSGKSTILSCLVGLIHNWQGEIEINGQLLGARRPVSFHKSVQLVFQDPYGSLHPRQTVDRALREPLLIHGFSHIDERVTSVLTEVGLGAAYRFRYPHQLSGGQRQRVAVARALIVEPEIVLLDEPTSALDVSVQAEVLNLLSEQRKKRNLTYIFVSHDLSVVGHMCDRISVMKDGVMVEEVTPQDLQKNRVETGYAKQLIVASRGYNRDAIDLFEDY